MTKCESGKVCHRNLHMAEIVAHSTARALNRAGEYSRNFYAFRCSMCRQFHLTSWDQYEGAPNILVMTAPPRWLQEWAMGNCSDDHEGVR